MFYIWVLLCEVVDFVVVFFKNDKGILFILFFNGKKIVVIGFSVKIVFYVGGGSVNFVLMYFVIFLEVIIIFVSRVGVRVEYIVGFDSLRWMLFLMFFIYYFMMGKDVGLGV